MSEQKTLWGWCFEGDKREWVRNLQGLPLFSYDKRVILAHIVANSSFAGEYIWFACEVADDGQPVEDDDGE